MTSQFDLEFMKKNVIIVKFIYFERATKSGKIVQIYSYYMDSDFFSALILSDFESLFKLTQ